MNPADHALLLPFDTEEPEFARGFEAGRLWALVREDAGEVEETVHTSNAEMLMRMGEALDRIVIGEELDGTWTRVRVLPEGTEPEPSPRPGFL